MKKVLFVLLAALSTAAAPSDDDLGRALALAAEARYSEARTVLDPLLARRPDHPRARLLDGILRAREGRVSESIEVFDRLRRDHPEMSEPWNHLAVLYAAERRFDEAREMLLVALERRPSTAGYVNLGDIYGELARRAGRRSRELAAQGGARFPPNGEQGAALSFPRDTSGHSAAAGGAVGPDVASPAAGSGEPAAVRIACLRAGGFHDRRILAEVEAWMKSHGADVFELRRERDRRFESWQVYLPPLESGAEAAAKLREIRARGVRDVAVIESGPLRNGISFGVFGVTENMRRRVAALESLGYRVRHRDGREAVQVYYFEARTSADSDGLRVAWAERFPDRSFELVDCR